MAEISAFGKALRDARVAAGLTQQQLSDAIGGKPKQQNIGGVEKGSRPGFSSEVVERIELALGLKRGDLAQHLPLDHPARLAAKLAEKVDKMSPAIGRHKVIGTVEAGRGVSEAADDDDWINLPEGCEGADGVYRVKGLSMKAAGILPGDYLVVRKTDAPGQGDLAVAWAQGYGAVVKRVTTQPGLYNNGTGYLLHWEDGDENRDPYTMDPSKGDRFYAVVIAVFRQVKVKGKPLRPVLQKPKKK